MSDETIEQLKIILKEERKDIVIAVLRGIKKTQSLKFVKEVIIERLKKKNKLIKFQFLDYENPIDEDVEEDLNLNEIDLLHDSYNSNCYSIYILKIEKSSDSNNPNKNINTNNVQKESNISSKIKENIKNFKEDQLNSPINSFSLNESNKINNKSNQSKINDIRDEINNKNENLSQSLDKGGTSNTLLIENKKKSRKELSLSQQNFGKENGEDNEKFNIQNEDKKNSHKKEIKTLIFFVIIQKEYSNKINFILKNNKIIIPIYEIQTKIIPYEDISMSRYILFKSVIQRNIIFYEVKIPTEYSSIKIFLEYGKKHYENIRQVDLGDKSNLIIIEFVPFCNNYLKENNIIFEISQNENEQDILLNCFFIYFKTKDINCKSIFIEKYIKYLKYNEEIQDFKKIFLIANFFENDFLGRNFLAVIKSFKTLKINQFKINQRTKDQINDLFKCIHDFQNKEEIGEDIWLLLILSLIKLQQKEKVKEIFSMVKVLKNRENIIGNIFSYIKLYFNVFPEIQEYFVDFLKLKQSEYDFIISKINRNEDYLNLIEKDFEVLTEKQIENLISKIHIDKADKTKLYLILLENIKKLEDFYKLWKIFGYYKSQEENKEKIIQKHIQKFWELFSKEQNNDEKIIKTLFFHMFFFLKENKLNNTSLEFLKKINEIKKESLPILIYENICKYTSDLNDEEKKCIYDCLLSLSEANFDSIINYNNIIHFIEQNVGNKEIKIEYFYHNNDEINNLFKIFSILNKAVESKKETNIQQINFLKNSKYNINHFIQSIYEKNINYYQLEKLNNSIKDHSLNKKFLFFNDSDKEKNELFKNIQKNYLYYKDLKNKLSECLYYLKRFRSTENSKQTNLINSKLRLIYSEKQLKKFDKSLNECFLDNLNKLFEKAKKFKKMINLKICRILMDKLENRIDIEDDEIVRYLENKINDTRKILSKKTMNEMSKETFFVFLSFFKGEEELIFEIKNLKAYFDFNEDTSILEKYLSFEFKKYKLSQTLENIIGIIYQFNLIKTEFFEKITKLKDNILNLEQVDNSRNSKDSYLEFDEEILDENIRKINQYISDFENFEPNLKLKIFPMDLISFTFNKLHVNSLLKFLFDLTINNLRDISDSLEGSSLNINDITNYQIIKNIIDGLKEECGFSERENEESKVLESDRNKPSLYDKQFLELIPIIINKKLYGKEKEEFEMILENCGENLPKLLILFNNKKEIEYSKEDLRTIINESIFEIYYDKNINSFENNYNCRCFYKERIKVKSLKELIYMQQLLSLGQNTEKNDENKIFNIFTDIIENINDILILIDKISLKGFPQEFFYIINVNKGEAYCKDMNIQKNKAKKLLETKCVLTKLLKNINQSQIEVYRNKKFLRFFYGKQISKFEKYLKDKIGKSSNKKEVSKLIYYIIGNKYKIYPDIKTNLESGKRKIEELNSNEISNKNQELTSRKKNLSKNELKKSIGIDQLKEGEQKELDAIMCEMYENVEDYLAEVMQLNGIEEKDIFENSIIKNKKYIKDMKKGFFIINSINNIYKQILKFYHSLVGDEPQRISLLLCNEETTLEEVISFIYLSAFCPYYSLFIIAKPDKLNIDILYEVINIIGKFNDDEIDINSYILFLFKDIGKCCLGNELLKICCLADEPTEDLRQFKENEISISVVGNKKLYQNIEIVKSIKAGFGKTLYIKKKCKENDLIYIPFPIGGEIKREIIMRRLEGLIFERNKNYGLHLDLSDTNKKEIFGDFLFSFLIQKVYSYKGKIFCYEGNLKIFIEIPNTSFNLMDNFELLNEFPIHIISKLPEFELSENRELFKDFEDMKYDLDNGISSFYDVQKKNEALNHNYLYKSDIQMVFNYLKFLDKNGKTKFIFL